VVSNYSLFSQHIMTYRWLRWNIHTFVIFP